MAEASKENEPDPGDGDALQELLRRAERGDESVLPELRRLLNEDPGIWKEYGDLGAQAEAALVRSASGTNLLLAESLARRLEALKAELSGPAPTALERLLVDRAAACWAQASYYDALAAQARAATPRQADELLRRQGAAHQRFLSALRALATMRRHLKPAAQPAPPPGAIAGRVGRKPRRAV